MFGFLFKGFSRYSKVDQLAADDMYAAALSHSRMPDFYIRYGVPDSFDGRFEMLVLHIYLIFYKLRKHKKYKDLSQCVFNRTFKDMELTLREIGVGDVGIPKHMKKMMYAFNGRMHAYRQAIEMGNKKDGVMVNAADTGSFGSGSSDEGNSDKSGDDLLFAALRRNVYGTVEKVSKAVVVDMEEYVLATLKHLDALDTDFFALGNVSFIDPGIVPKSKKVIRKS